MIASLALWLAVSVPGALFAGRFIRAGMVDGPHDVRAQEVGP